MSNDEIDAAIRAVWVYLRPDAPTAAGIVYEREIFRTGMRAAAKICEAHISSMEGAADEVAKRECAAHIRKAAE